MVPEPAQVSDGEAEHAIRRVRRIWAYSRDQGDWDGLAACFHPDADVNISWYCGPAAGFVAAARQATARRLAGESSRHWLGNYRAAVRGDRATLESDVQILTRDMLDGHLVDCTSWGRFFDLFEKRDGTWRIAKWTAIYEKDRIDPVVPGSLPSSFFAALDLTSHHGNGAFMRLRVSKKGRVPAASMVMGDTDAELHTKAEGMEWLRG